jgi:hypothetical protein
MPKLVDITNVNSIRNLKTEDLILLQALLNSTKFIRIQNVLNGLASTFIVVIVLFTFLSKIMKIELYINDRKLI